jgi:hypothetical protein
MRYKYRTIEYSIHLWRQRSNQRKHCCNVKTTNNTTSSTHRRTTEAVETTNNIASSTHRRTTEAVDGMEVVKQESKARVCVSAFVCDTHENVSSPPFSVVMYAIFNGKE